MPRSFGSIAGSAVLVGLVVAAAAAPASAGRVLDVPYFSQDRDLCGGAAVAMVRRWWGDLRARPEDLRPAIVPARGGIPTQALVRALEDDGWRARVFRGDDASVRRLLGRGCPVLALIDAGGPTLHYVVIVGAGDGAYTIHDPADGPFREIDQADFLDRWSATDRWALAVLAPSGHENGTSASAERDRASIVGDAERGDAHESASPQDDELRLALRRARAGELEEAERGLERILVATGPTCELLTELAGVRLRRGDLKGAQEAARHACGLDPRTRPAREILAASLRLLGRDERALDEWNRVDRPRVGHLDVEGARSMRHRVVERSLGVRPGQLLTVASLRQARRAVLAIPAVERARVGYRIERDGTATLEVRILERRRWPDSRWSWFAEGVRYATRSEIRVRASNVVGAGDAWSLTWLDDAHRGSMDLEVVVPGVGHSRAITRLRGGRQWASMLQDGRLIRREDRHLGLAVEPMPAARWRPRLMLSRHAGDAEVWWRGAVRLDGELGSESRRLSGGVGWWARPTRAVHALEAEVRVDAATADVAAGWRAVGRAGAHAIDARTPFWAWPGAGVGIARAPLLRAHPLLRDGVIEGEGFGPTLLHGGAEAQWWTRPRWALRPGLALFADAARGGDPRPRAFVDVGAGVRLELPGGRGTLCLDFAMGVLDDARAVSLVLRADPFGRDVVHLRHQ